MPPKRARGANDNAGRDDNWDDDHPSRSSDEEPQPMALSEERKREIAGRKKFTRPAKSASSSGQAAAPVFSAGFGLGTSSAAAPSFPAFAFGPTAAAASTNPASMTGFAPFVPPSALIAPATTSAAPSPAFAAFVPPTATPAPAASPAASASGYQSAVRGLNEQWAKHVQKVVAKTPAGDLSKIAREYLAYIDELKAKHGVSNGTSSTAPSISAATAAPPTAAAPSPPPVPASMPAASPLAKPAAAPVTTGFVFGAPPTSFAAAPAPPMSAALSFGASPSATTTTTAAAAAPAASAFAGFGSTPATTGTTPAATGFAFNFNGGNSASPKLSSSTAAAPAAPFGSTFGGFGSTQATAPATTAPAAVPATSVAPAVAGGADDGEPSDAVPTGPTSNPLTAVAMLDGENLQYESTAQAFDQPTPTEFKKRGTGTLRLFRNAADTPAARVHMQVGNTSSGVVLNVRIGGVIAILGAPTKNKAGKTKGKVVVKAVEAEGVTRTIALSFDEVDAAARFVKELEALKAAAK
ncbi:hypothetical protein BC828DRAFT_397572 [Blastocladiella britannica]|nr:hypothetical protein BC828DRAFT_397572 [Blastocladiella britannica]